MVVSASASSSTSASTSASEDKQPVQRIPGDAAMPSQLSSKILLGLIIPSMIHSCIHLLGWNLQYPTTIEKQLWRVSAVTLAGTSCLAVGAVRVLRVVGYKGRYNLVWFWVNADSRPEAEGSNARGKGIGRALANITVFEVVLTFATLALVLARLFIIVEVIISLRSQPQDLYTSVNWVGFIPHV